MRRVAISLSLVGLVFLFCIASVRAADALPAGANTVCPVMTDQPTRADRFVDYNGKRIYFCCDKCVARFQRDPAKFIANLQPDGTVVPAAAANANSAEKPADSISAVQPTLFSKPLWQLFGRLHVVVVHFPIALIILAGGIELFRIRKSQPSDIARFCLTLGALAAIVAAGMGWIDAANQFGVNPPRALAYHRWLGIVMAVSASFTALVALLISRYGAMSLVKIYRPAVLFCALGVGIVGHFGGTLTYGDDYFTAIFKTSAPTAVTAQSSGAAVQPAVSPSVSDSSAVATQTLLYGTDQDIRETRIRLRLAQVPAPPAPPTVDVPVNNEIDQFIAAKWKADKLDEAVHPPELCDDATFARRVYLDVIGVIPTTNELAAFLGSKSPHKRDKLIDQLLARNNDYAANWTPYFEDALASSPFESQGGVRSHGNYQPWILASFQTNRPYDVMLSQLIDPTADGYQKQSSINVLGAQLQVGYVLNDDHKNTLQSAANFGQFFLGTGMKCATCHSHFLNDEWPQARFAAFGSMFGNADLELIRCEKSSGKFAPAKYPFDMPDGPTTMPSDAEHRLHLVARMTTDPANPRFARTAVNRLWRRYLGLGLFEPIDDYRLDTPAANPALLDWLAYDFIQHGYDLKHTIRLILTSRTYQLRYDPKLEDHFDLAKRDLPRYWRSPSLRKLSAEQLIDSIRVATEQHLVDSQRLYHSVESTSLTRDLGRPASRNEIATARSDDVAIVQSLELLNGQEWSGLVYNSAIVRQLIHEEDSEKLTDRLYRAFLSRSPTSDEKAVAADFLKSPKSEPATQPATTEIVWVDDSLPVGAKIDGSRGGQSLVFAESPAPVQMGQRSLTLGKTDETVQGFFITDTPISLHVGDALSAYVYLDPKSPPREIMLQWNDGSWEHRAYWGENLIPFGADQTGARYDMGALPTAGQWVRLVVPIENVALNPGAKISLMSFDQSNGQVWWDHVSIIKRPAIDSAPLGDLIWALITSPEFQYVH